MASKNHELPGSFYQRSGRWWWDVKLPGAPQRKAVPLKPDGHQYATTDQKVAVAIATRMWKRAEAEANGQTTAFDGSFPAFREKVLATARFNYGEDGAEYERCDLATRWCLGDAKRPAGFPRTVEDVRPAHIESLMLLWADQGLARRTINQRMKVLLRLFKWAARDGLITPEQYGALTLVEALRPGVTKAAEPKEITSVDKTIVDVTLWFAPQVIRDMVELQTLTGMRSGELCSISWNRIDAKGEAWFYVPAKHKTAHKGKVRVIAIGPKGQAILKRYEHRPKEAPIFSAREAMEQRIESRQTKAKHVITPARKARMKGCDGYQDGYDSYGYRQAIDYAIAAAKKAGHKVPSWHPHQLRHSKATGTFLTLGHDHASAALGHSGKDVTMIYVDKDAQLQQQMRLAAEVALKVG